jgi:hypothetical protein
MPTDYIEHNGKTLASVNEMSRKTGYSVHYIRDLAAKDKIPGFKIGRAWWIDLKAALEILITKPEVSQEQEKDAASDDSEYLDLIDGL